MIQTAFISIKVGPFKKGSSTVGDIERVRMLKVDDKLESELLQIDFFPLEYKTLSSSIFDLKDIKWRCLELEENMSELRRQLSNIKLIICQDKISYNFISQVVKDDRVQILNLK